VDVEAGLEKVITWYKMEKPIPSVMSERTHL